jgi:hypothetical protein
MDTPSMIRKVGLLAISLRRWFRSPFVMTSLWFAGELDYGSGTKVNTLDDRIDITIQHA